MPVLLKPTPQIICPYCLRAACAVSPIICPTCPKPCLWDNGTAQNGTANSMLGVSPIICPTCPKPCLWDNGTARNGNAGGSSASRMGNYEYAEKRKEESRTIASSFRESPRRVQAARSLPVRWLAATSSISRESPFGSVHHDSRGSSARSLALLEAVPNSHRSR